MTLVAQLRELLFPPPSTSSSSRSADGGGAWPTERLSVGELVGRSVDGCSAKVESGGLPGASHGTRRRRGSKRAQEDQPAAAAKHEQHDDEPAGANAQPLRRKRSRMQQKSASLVTSTPDIHGYQWRKYGQKQIEGAMYPRSYYRCTRSAEQGCPAKRTVQRNDDDGGDGAPPKYTVVYTAEHTCRSDDSLEAPVILETTAVASTATTKKSTPPEEDDDSSIAAAAFMAAPAAASTTSTGTESPAISDITWSSTTTSEHVDDYFGRLFAVVDDSWAPSPAASSSFLQEIDDFTGPIRSPVHIAADGWAMDNFLAAFSF